MNEIEPLNDPPRNPSDLPPLEMTDDEWAAWKRDTGIEPLNDSLGLTTDEEIHDYLHEKFDRLHTTSAACALMDFHAEHGCDRKADDAD